MVIDKNTFVSAISVTGYPFFRASYDTQVNTINAFISMMDSLEDPISLKVFGSAAGAIPRNAPRKKPLSREAQAAKNVQDRFGK